MVINVFFRLSMRNKIEPAEQTQRRINSNAVSEKKSYELNPHRHVKIWLSMHPDLFMNPENQLRLVQMRASCPGDVIHLIYDHRLLSIQAINDLHTFCLKHDLTAMDACYLIAQCTHPLEKALAELYQDEISHLNAGGNLGAASDILRWLSPVFQLGVYSDLDVVVSTQKLAPRVQVFGDLLVSVGNYHNVHGDAHLAANNDIIAVINPHSEMIRKIQSYIFNACQPKIAYHHIQKIYKDYSPVRFTQNHLGTLFTPREFRAVIPTIVRNTFANKLFSHMQLIELYESIEKKLYMGSVTMCTGPKAILNLFLNQFDYTNESVDSHIAPYALGFYPELFKAFQSKQIIALHESYQDRAKRTICPGDLSWIENGQRRMKERELGLHRHAQTIQRFWMQRNPKKAEPAPEASCLHTEFAKTCLGES